MSANRVFHHGREINVTGSEVKAYAATAGMNGCGSTLQCEPFVTVDVRHRESCMSARLPFMTPAQARELAAELVAAADWAEQSPEDAAARKAVQS